MAGPALPRDAQLAPSGMKNAASFAVASGLGVGIHASRKSANYLAWSACEWQIRVVEPDEAWQRDQVQRVMAAAERAHRLGKGAGARAGASTGALPGSGLPPRCRLRGDGRRVVCRAGALSLIHSMVRRVHEVPRRLRGHDPCLLVATRFYPLRTVPPGMIFGLLRAFWPGSRPHKTLTCADRRDVGGGGRESNPPATATAAHRC